VSEAPPLEVRFGGPDLPRRCLRDWLAERVRAVPAGGSIDWVTYYLRDRPLAAELVAARRRGVQVRLALEARPRTRRANRAAIDLLQGEAGLAAGLRLVDDGPLPGLGALRPRLHEKLYCFSHPEPVAIVGSFNPSGDEPEQAPDIVDEIRDQDRGHNVLVALRDPALVAGLVAHARRLHRGGHGALARFHPAANRTLRSANGATEVHFGPRALPHPLVRRLARCGAGARVRIAASHLSGPTARRALAGLARRGARVEIVAEWTERRVPPATERALAAAGIAIARLRDAEGLPMHCKFALIERGASEAEREVVFGSFNWTERSLRLNRELGVASREPALWRAFDARWRRLAAESLSL
jgi:phosphatidylserine/phosphatidylglycerophosphate/cardiolipin synthase-like enzyme